MKILPSGAMPTQPLTRPVRSLELKYSSPPKSAAVSHQDSGFFGATYLAGLLWGSSGFKAARQAGRLAGSTFTAQKVVISEGPKLPSPVFSWRKLPSTSTPGSGETLERMLETTAT